MRAHLSLEREYSWWLPAPQPLPADPRALVTALDAEVTEVWRTSQSTLLFDDDDHSLTRARTSLAVLLRHGRDTTRAWVRLKETLLEEGGRRDAVQLEQELDALTDFEAYLDPSATDPPEPIRALRRRRRDLNVHLVAVITQRRHKLRARLRTGSHLLLSLDELTVHPPDQVSRPPVLTGHCVDAETEDDQAITSLDEWAVDLGHQLAVPPGGPSKASRALAAIPGRSR